MNSGFYPKVLFPHAFRTETQSQQPPFYFGASSVPYDLGMNIPALYIHHSGIPNVINKLSDVYQEHKTEEKKSKPKKQRRPRNKKSEK